MKANNIKSNDWLIRGVGKEQLKTEKALAIIAAKIQLRRLELGMDQKEFAKHMGVSQGMVSRWESGNYNFTISTLISICEKLELSFEPEIKTIKEKKDNIVFVDLNTKKEIGWDAWKPSTRRVVSGGAA
ncbi:MAG: helix-turn-helix transcriptional regulator [Clostridia bacterium]|nr:helix-turn-helix transcriptional regulator [Clostridia bacterium]